MPVVKECFRYGRVVVVACKAKRPPRRRQTVLTAASPFASHAPTVRAVSYAAFRLRECNSLPAHKAGEGEPYAGVEKEETRRRREAAENSRRARAWHRRSRCFFSPPFPPLTKAGTEASCAERLICPRGACAKCLLNPPRHVGRGEHLRVLSR